MIAENPVKASQHGGIAQRSGHPKPLMVFGAITSDGEMSLIFLEKGVKVDSKTYLKGMLEKEPWKMLFVGCIGLVTALVSITHNVLLFYTFNCSKTIDIESLFANEGFYTVTTDISSFLPILACALRLPIYAINDKQIKTEVICQVHEISERISTCCPILGRILCLQKKYSDSEKGTEIMCGHSSSRGNHSNDGLQARHFGVGTLILARASVNSSAHQNESQPTEGGTNV
nr:Hypothetical protein CBG05848 [Haemonchus contortus]